MPGTFTIVEARSLVLSRGWGVITEQELLEHVTALRADPRFKPHFHQLGDLRDATGYAGTTATIRRMAQLSPFGSGSRRAVVAGTDVIYGMMRMFQILRDDLPDEIEVFRDLVAAFEWLGLMAERDELNSILRRPPELQDWATASRTATRA